MQSKINNLWNILRFTFAAVPIIAGLDKFTNILVQWDKYLVGVQSMIPFSPAIFMNIVGVIEIGAGVMVFIYTKLGSYVVTAWLVGIALTLITGGMFDIAVRDLVMAVAAFALAQLTDLKEQTV